MLRRLIFSLILFATIVVLYFSFTDWRSDRAMLNGEVHGVPQQDTTRSEDDAASIAAKPFPTQTAPANSSNTTASVPMPAEKPSAVALTSDTIGPNPPNGTVFAGSGRYQVYRQGDLTWRLDTDTGRTCVLFATLEEWKKPLVYHHGCGPGASQ